MPRLFNPEDAWEDEEPEYPDYDDDEEPTIPCPHCRREIHEDSDRCPYCERYLSKEDMPPARKPWWLIIGVAVCLYVVYRWNALW
jgi:hypothetical protein